ncbi:ATP-dependent RNA helicase HrpA [Desulfolithobacter sp.]
MRLHYPPELPISAKREQIVQAIRNHQALVIAGDTGSGKTTQLPKMCLEAGLGAKKGIIGCTQPRRIAAVAVAERVAEELGEAGIAGYKIRFQDHTSPATRIKFMTDGILLAESRGDRLLSAYDVLIIDEAHERSLNIDFLLGYLKQLLSRRPELKLIISSATIDTDKFSDHFKAPVIKVSGRNHPVTIEYVDEVLDETAQSCVDLAVRETIRLARRPEPGDILVFMPTERDIHDTMDGLHHQLDNHEIMPLFGRLQGRDQRKIFKPSPRRKIIVATNVAETSITVPGVRYVVDTGLARLARYNVRARTTSLHVTRISRASCDQRAGRCGRTGPGICVRLYSKEDYLSRSEYTLPEIQRSNLAEVILQMISLRLGDPRKFPFIDPPSPRAVNEGYTILRELGALDAKNQLTSRGKLMAKLPLDPCISRIIIEGESLGALREIEVIAAALSIMDPRIRPAEQLDKAKAAHLRFLHPKSDFLTLLNIWDRFHHTGEKTGSMSRLRKFCKANFLSWQRMREWMDVHAQIRRILKEQQGFRENREDASYEAVHQALVAGFLRNIARKKNNGEDASDNNKPETKTRVKTKTKTKTKNIYQAAGGREVMLFPGSTLYNRGGEWIVAADFVATSRLFARTAANINVDWLERLGGELCRRSWSDPHWEKKPGQVIAFEKVTLFGLVLTAARKVAYGRISRKKREEARQIFIQEALVSGRLGGNYSFLKHNLALCQQITAVEERVRRRGIMVDEQVLYDFYDQRLPAWVHDRFTLNRFLRQNRNRDDRFLRMCEKDICHGVPEEQELYLFPETMQTGQGPLTLHYRFEPGHEADGVTVDIPVQCVAQLRPEIFEWLVPGLLPDKILHLLKGLPKRLRRLLVPLPQAVDRILDGVTLYRGSLYPAIEKALLKQYHVTVKRTDWQTSSLPIHLRMRYRLLDSRGKTMTTSRSFQEILAAANGQPQHSAKTTPGSKVSLPERENIRTWDFDGIPAQIPIHDSQGKLAELYFPTLFIDEARQCLTLRCIKDREKSREQNRSGLRFLYSLQFPGEMKLVRRECKVAFTTHSGSWIALGIKGTERKNREALEGFLLDGVFGVTTSDLPDREQFERTVTRVREKGLFRSLKPLLDEVLLLIRVRREVQAEIHSWGERARRQRHFVQERFDAWFQEVDRLLPPDFLHTLVYNDIIHTNRYLRALSLRIQRAEQDPAKDEQKARHLARALHRLDHLPPAGHRSGACEQLIREYRQMVEEFKVAVFAPELGTAMPVSEKRLARKWQKLEETCHRVE